MRLKIFVALLFFLFITGIALTEGPFASPVATAGLSRGSPRPPFPSAFFNSYLQARAARDAAQPYSVPTEAELRAQMAFYPPESLLMNNYILAFYGHPLSRYMGVLGRYPKEELLRQMTVLAEEYRAIGGRNIIKAFYLIYGTVWPGGEIGILRESILREWIEFALANDMLIFIDHQIGRFDPIDSLRRMFRWLHYPNVHLALDPEWRTARPMQEIGHLTAAELNRAQQLMEDYIIENNLPGERFLVVHQFNHIMLRNRYDIRSDFSRVRFVHCISGIGTPAMKKATYAFGARATNIPVKGFKLWFDFGIPGHTDIPLMTPAEVMALQPRPYIIMYQ